MSNDLIKRFVPESGVPATVDYGEDAGAGFGKQTTEDIRIPFIRLPQGLSPEVQNGVDGAKIGKFVNGATGEMLDEFLFVPAAMLHLFIEWKANRQGFVERHEPESPFVALSKRQAKADGLPFGKLKVGTCPDGIAPGSKQDPRNDLQETYYVFGLILREDGPMPACIAFTSTKISVYRNWNTTLRFSGLTDPQGNQVTPPLFANLVAVSSTKVTKGPNTWSQLVLVPAIEKDLTKSRLAPDNPLYKNARTIAQQVAAGIAKVDDSELAGEGKSDEDTF
jgi:hypothetical protein